MRQIVVACLMLLSATLGQAQTTATLRGSVKDYAGNVLAGPDCVVKVTGGGIEKSAAVGQSGIFTFELPPGIYQVTANAQWVYPVRRAAVRLHPGETLTVNLMPSLAVSSVGTKFNPTAD